jgi:Fe-S-cluster containining protein
VNIVREKGFDFRFDPTACEDCPGHFCTGQPGYTWVNEKEICKISNFWDLGTDDFANHCLVRIGNRCCLKEMKIKGSFHCVFFDEQNRKCSIHSARPTQCRTFPFWAYFKNNPHEAIKECPGVRVM